MKELMKMKITKITGSIKEGQNIRPQDLNIVIRKINEVVNEINSINYRLSDTNRKVLRNTTQRVKESANKR